MSKAISAVVNKMFVEYGLVYFNFLVNVVNVVEMDVCWTQFAVVQFSSGGTFLLHTDAQLPCRLGPLRAHLLCGPLR